MVVRGCAVRPLHGSVFRDEIANLCNFDHAVCSTSSRIEPRESDNARLLRS